MQCLRCAADVDVAGVFPGGGVRCACGAENVVPLAPLAAAAVTPSVEEQVPAAGYCPRCARSLAPTAVHDQPASGCHQCGGAFVEHAQLAELVSTALAEAENVTTPMTAAHPVERAVRYLRCPRCPEVMQRLVFGRKSGILLDACRVHGTWFDIGELDAALDFVRSGGLHGQVGLAAAQVRASDPDVTQAAKLIEAALHEESMRAAQSVQNATDFVDDLLWIISPGRHWAWEQRRR